MLGRMILVGSLGTALAAAVVWTTGGRLPAITNEEQTADTSSVPEIAPVQKKADKKVPIGHDLYARAEPAVPPQPPPVAEKPPSLTYPVVIPNARLGLIHKEDVPAQRDGVLMFVGIEVKAGETVPKEDLFTLGDGSEKKIFRRLKLGDEIQAGQLLAKVDNTLAHADVLIKQAKVVAAEKDRLESEKTRDEMRAQYETQLKLLGAGTGRGQATSEEEMRTARLRWVRYIYETESKEQAINVAREEYNQAKKTDEIHEIRSKINGIVKTLYKHTGESVKNLEPVVQIQNYDLLQVEGLLEAQYARKLQKGMRVVIEPTVRQPPVEFFRGHRLDITGVAVSKDRQHPLIVSCSEDGTAMVWERWSKRPRQVLRHPLGASVLAVACTPPGSATNLCLTGSSDGVARIWDLDSKSEKALELQGHKAAIRCVCFSPDGTKCATGGEDNNIRIWNVATGACLYEIPGHRNYVTALYFTPQSQLVSVSRDNTVRLWRLGENGAEPAGELKRRSHEVDQLGVSPDGKQVLDEQGREMRFLSLPDFISENVLQNTSQTSHFQKLALFSPDGRFVITTSGADGTFQLWRIGETRSYELRQLICGERSQPACAAFSPDGTFVVGGIKDRMVYVWSLPTREESERQLEATITNIEQDLQSVESKVRIMAEFNNPADYRLMPGDVVNVVAYLQR